MLTLTSQYALRAAIFLAQHTDEWPITGRRIADEANIPPKYLSKVLGDLVRSGVLESARGKAGGFRLRNSPGETMLFDLLEPFEPLELRRCPFGNNVCSNEHPCLAHDQWKKVVEAERRFLKETSVRDVAVGGSRARPRTNKAKR